MELDPPLLWKGQPNVNQFRRTIKYTHMTQRKRGAHLRTGRQFLRGQGNYNIEALNSVVPSRTTTNVDTYRRHLLFMRVNRHRISKFYASKSRRHALFQRFRNRLISDARFIARIKAEFNVSKIVVVLGDGGETKTKKGQIGSMTYGLRRLFDRHGIPYFLLNEFRTSSYCPDCHEKVEHHFRERLNAKPWRAAVGHRAWVNGLLGCTSEECTTVVAGGVRQPRPNFQPDPHLQKLVKYWNRDDLACRNMCYIVLHLLAGYFRPPPFSLRQ
ncbi:hypothetical protein BDZ88DRAFT_451761 [Geranomyces variabilis]|nr:hypothetical protein BDZ88DRAFT_451761 [Geranomyces variabilis]